MAHSAVARARPAPAAAARRALRRVLADAEADALLVVGASSRDPDLLPFIGEARLGACFVVVRSDGARWLGYHSAIEREEAASAGIPLLHPALLRVGDPVRGHGGPGGVLARSLGIALDRAKVAGPRVALAGRYPNGELAQALTLLRRRGWRFGSGHRALLRLRRAKRGAELAEIRAIAAATADAIRRVAGLLAAAVPGRRARAGQRRSGTARMARSRPRAPELVWCGEPLTVGVVRREVAAAFAAAHAAVLDALRLARSRAAPGTRGIAIQEEVCRHFEALGYGTTLGDRAATRGYVHGLGHGVGFEVHELPHFRRDGARDEGTLDDGDVFTLEPGLYDPVIGYGVRLEDLLYLGPAGLENLTPLPYDLDPRAWPRHDAF